MARYLSKILFTITWAVLAAACAAENEPPLPERLPLVIEGWIENGQHPVVIVTRAVNLTQNIESFDQFVERWCRVTIDDGNRKEVLTGRVNNAYVPSFIFTTTKITGQAGRTYRLTVETETDTATASATIGRSVRIDSLKVTPCADSDTLFQIHAFPRVDKSPDAYYKFFTKVNNEEQRYYSSFLGTFEGACYDSTTGFNVARGIHQTYDGENKFTPYFTLGDTVSIKLCTLEKPVFDFWNAYENSVSLSGNVFLNVSQSCPSNISGAKGYWAAYATTQAFKIIR